MGSPTRIARPASSPTRRKFVNGRGPDESGSKLKALRPHWPERSGMGAAISAPSTGQVKIAAERPTAARLKCFRESTRMWSVSLEDHQRIDRRSGAAFHRHRREGDHELVAVQPPRRRDELLEIEALHN